jgi:hypothetical protein
MSFAERIEQQLIETANLGDKRCALANLFTDDRLTNEDQEKLKEVVDCPASDPRRLSMVTIALALRAEGIEISKTAIGDHRRKACRCYSKKDDSQ